jgi:hypothetical protein
MMFDQGMDLTLLLRSSEGEVMATQCNFHGLQIILFNNE